MEARSSIEQRVARHAALGDATRLAIVDELRLSDRSPVELRHRFGLESNLLAHHLDVLEEVGLINRTRSSGDGRRRYVHLVPEALAARSVGTPVVIGPALFICTANSARSQLAAALWNDLGGTAQSAGTHPADTVHPGAVAAAGRAGLDLQASTPKVLDNVEIDASLVVTVCDRAHEEIEGSDSWLHWSIPDPVMNGSDAAFDAALAELRLRMGAMVDRGRAA